MELSDDYSKLMPEATLLTLVDELEQQLLKAETDIAFFMKDLSIFKIAKDAIFTDYAAINAKLKTHDRRYGKLLEIDTDLKHAFGDCMLWSSEGLILAKKSTNNIDNLLINFNKIIKQMQTTIDNTKNVVTVTQTQIKIARQAIEQREDEIRNFLLLDSDEKEVLAEDLNKQIEGDSKEQPLQLPTTQTDEDFDLFDDDNTQDGNDDDER